MGGGYCTIKSISKNVPDFKIEKAYMNFDVKNYQ